MTVSTQDWLARAERMPLAFSQVREDSLLDQLVVDELGADVDVLMVASGGCTAAYLASLPSVRRLELVDPNPAQLALTRTKLWLLEHADRDERLAVLGHQPLSHAERQQRISNILAELELPRDVFGPIDEVAQLGPDHVGRYELLFAALREQLSPGRGEWRAFLHSPCLADQWVGLESDEGQSEELDAALAQVMALPHLVRLFGEGATRNRVRPFDEHFGRQVRWALTTMPAATNPYLWQMLVGSYPPAVTVPWLECPRVKDLPDVCCYHDTMLTVLNRSTQKYDFVHLSNILDWLSPEEAGETLALAFRALRPGGSVLIRQLNSGLDVRQAGGMFDWCVLESDGLLERDRSFFYRAIHWGRKP